MADFYLDVNAATGTLTGTLNFTNGDTRVTGTGTLFTTELQVGDYIRSTDTTNGGTWYKVISIIDDVTLTINTAFKEATHSAAAEYNRGDGSQTNPFCSINQFVSVAVGGDTLYCQLGQTQKLVNYDSYPYVLLPGGDAINPIKIIGSDWKNIGVTGYFELDLQYNITLYADYDTGYRIFDAIKFSNRPQESYAYNAVLVSWNRTFTKFTNCYFYNCDICIKGSSIVENCTFDTCNILFQTCNVYARNITTINCTTLSDSSSGVIINTDLTSAQANDDTYSSTIIFLGSPQATITNEYSDYILNHIPHPFRISGVYGDIYYISNLICDISKDTATTFSSGNTAIKIVPKNTSFVSKDFPVCIASWYVDNVPAGSHTITVNVKTSGVTVFPTADELFVEVLYPDSTTSPSLGIIKSTETVTADNTETQLTVNFTSAVDGRIEIRVWYGYSNGTDTAPIIYIEDGFTIT